MLLLTLFGGFSMARADGTEISIKSKKARALLAYLALSPRMSRSREEIMALLWSHRGEAQARASLRQELVRLRKDLNVEAAGALVITNETVALDPDRITIETASQGEELLAGFHLHDPAFEDWLRDERLRQEDKEISNIQLPELPLPDKPSVVVLPFVNMSGDAEQQYFSDGITENIITGLTRFRELFVIAVKSSAAVRDETPNLEQIGHRLGVAHIVEGSVRKAGNRVRVTAQLVEAANGHRVWAEHYDRDLDDIFAVQDEITNIIVATLAGRIEEAERQRAAQVPINDMAAFDYLLRGKQCLNRGAKDGVLEARRHFERARELDPEFSTTYANLARSYMLEYDSDWTEARPDALKQAYKHAEKAVALDQGNSTAWYALAWAQLFRNQHELANIAIERAIALNPNDYHNLCMKGWCLVLSGDLGESIACLKEALRVNPFAPVDCLVAMGIAEYTARHYEASIEHFGKITGWALLKHACLAACYAQLSRDRQAGAALAEALERARTELSTQPETETERLRTYLADMFRFQNPSSFEHLLDGLRKAGLED